MSRTPGNAPTLDQEPTTPPEGETRTAVAAPNGPAGGTADDAPPKKFQWNAEPPCKVERYM